MPVNAQSFNFSLAARTGRQMSGFWADCPIDSLVARSTDAVMGNFQYDDFTRMGLAPTLTTQIAWGGYKAFATASSAIRPKTSLNSVITQNGFLEFSMDTTADASASVADPYPYAVINQANSTNNPLGGKFWFEGSVMVGSIAAAKQGFFLGLAETDLWTLATGVPFSGGTGAITNAAAAVGFRLGPNLLGVVDAVTSDRATSFRNVMNTTTGSGANTTIGASAVTTLAAFTFTRLGMKFDPSIRGNDPTVPRNCALQFYVNGLITSVGVPLSAVPSGIFDISLGGSTNLKAASLGRLFSVINKDTSVTAGTVGLQWWAFAQTF